MAAYFCAGFGYVISATFIVAIVNGLPGLAGQGGLAFSGDRACCCAGCCFNWDLIARYTGDINALILAALLQIVGIILPVAVGADSYASVPSFFLAAPYRYGQSGTDNGRALLPNDQLR